MYQDVRYFRDQGISKPDEIYYKSTFEHVQKAYKTLCKYFEKATGCKVASFSCSDGGISDGACSYRLDLFKLLVVGTAEDQAKIA